MVNPVAAFGINIVCILLLMILGCHNVIMSNQMCIRDSLSCMTENDCQEPVIGVSFDGTGYGMDGTIWGGEILLADMEGFQRLGSITPFLQVGGDASAKEGWRIAASLIYQMTGSKERCV